MTIDQSSLNNKWDSFEYVSLDLEGTGPQHREKEGIVDIAGVLVRHGNVTNESYQQLLNPEISIPFFISKIHGIYDKDVVDKPLFSDIRPRLEEFLAGHIMIAHNATVERRVLGFKMPSYAPPIILDTLKLSRHLYPGQKHGLDNLIERFNLLPVLDALQGYKRHSAYYDAIATAHAFVHMLRDKLAADLCLRELFRLCAIVSNIPECPIQDSDSEQQGLFQ